MSAVLIRIRREVADYFKILVTVIGEELYLWRFFIGQTENSVIIMLKINVSLIE
jgi:hypothetical protein